MRVLLPGLLACLAALPAMEWNEFRANGSCSIPAEGWTPVERLADAKLVWTSEAVFPHPCSPSISGYGSPVVADGQVYLYYRLGNRDSFNPDHVAIRKRLDKDGDRYPLPREQSYAMVTDGVVLCTDVTTGKTLWSTNLGPEAPCVIGRGASKAGGHHTVAVFDGKVYVPTTDWLLRCLDAETGAILWTVPLDQAKHDTMHACFSKAKNDNNFDWNDYVDGRCGFPNSCPTLAGGVLVIGSHRNLIGFDPATGERRWTLRETVNSNNSPVRWTWQEQEFVLVGGVQGALACVDPRAGKVLWSEEGCGVDNSVAVEGNLVIVNGDDSADEHKDAWTMGRPLPAGFTPRGMACYEISERGATLRWRHFAQNAMNYSFTTIHQGHVYGCQVTGVKRLGGPDGSRNYHYTCTDLATGEERARINFTGKTTCVQYKAIGRMVLAMNGLEVLRADPADFRLVDLNRGRPEFGDACVDPAFAGHLMITRGAHHLYGFDLRAGSAATPVPAKPFRPNLTQGKRVLASSCAASKGGKLDIRAYDRAVFEYPEESSSRGNPRTFLAWFANDNDPHTIWRWAEDQTDAWLVVDLAAPIAPTAPRAIDRIVVKSLPADGETLQATVSIGASAEGPWTAVGKGTLSKGKTDLVLDRVAKDARFVRLDIADAKTGPLSTPCGIVDLVVQGPPPKS